MLTKSLFSLAVTCPTKLYYWAQDYPRQEGDTAFLEALAEGGFQVEALAQDMFPKGRMIDTQDTEAAARETREWVLSCGDGVLFQAGLVVDGVAARVDILRKQGRVLDIIEVKAKSYEDDDEILKRTAGKADKFPIVSEWKPYIMDIAFQHVLAEKAFPDLEVRSFLMLPHKGRRCTQPALNSKYRIDRSSGQTQVIRRPGPIDSQLLVQIPTSEAVEVVKHYGMGDFKAHPQKIWEDITTLKHALKSGQRLHPTLATKCKACEFVSHNPFEKSGLHECWQAKRTDRLVLELWNAPHNVGHLIDSGKRLLSDLEPEDFPENNTVDLDLGLTSKPRQWLQVLKVKTNDSAATFLKNVFERFMDEKVRWPINLIDFETSRVALPFFKGQRPYEQIFFQFSHHILEQDGRLSHASQALHVAPGEFPNFTVLRALKEALSQNEGSIFRYSHHENTVLCDIHDQLQESDESDRDELCAWIESVTARKGNAKEKERLSWPEGPRMMLDLLDWVKRCYYHPRMKGSNSIKDVLPAILGDSLFLKEMFSQPIYGTHLFPSHNFKQHTWVNMDSAGEVANPYDTLGPLIPALEGVEEESMHRLFKSTAIQKGGEAMMAYAALQFSEMNAAERADIAAALLRYCELDTLAMAMILMAWRQG